MMSSYDIRAALRMRLLGALPAAIIPIVIQELERIVRDSHYGLDPGRSWYGPKNDTMVVWLGEKLVAALCYRSVPMLDPLLFEADDVPLPSLVLNDLRLRTEGALTLAGNDEYFFRIPANADPKWLQSIQQLGGSEDLMADGTRFFRRKL